MGGDVDENVTQTHPTVPPQEPFYSVFTVLSSCRTLGVRDVGDEMCLRFRDVGDDDVDDRDGV